MKKNLVKGKTALTTGASSGVGRECVRQFAEHGVNLIIAARRIDRLKTLVSKLFSKYQVEIISMQLDVQNKEQVRNAFDLLKSELLVQILQT